MMRLACEAVGVVPTTEAKRPKADRPSAMSESRHEQVQ